MLGAPLTQALLSMAARLSPGRRTRSSRRPSGARATTNVPSHTIPSRARAAPTLTVHRVARLIPVSPTTSSAAARRGFPSAPAGTLTSPAATFAATLTRAGRVDRMAFGRASTPCIPLAGRPATVRRWCGPHEFTQGCAVPVPDPRRIPANLTASPSTP
jgi:hypothetical protein